MAARPAPLPHYCPTSAARAPLLPPGSGARLHASPWISSGRCSREPAPWAWRVYKGRARLSTRQGCGVARCPGSCSREPGIMLNGECSSLHRNAERRGAMSRRRGRHVPSIPGPRPRGHARRADMHMAHVTRTRPRDRIADRDWVDQLAVLAWSHLHPLSVHWCEPLADTSRCQLAVAVEFTTQCAVHATRRVNAERCGAQRDIALRSRRKAEGRCAARVGPQKAAFMPIATRQTPMRVMTWLPTSSIFVSLDASPAFTCGVRRGFVGHGAPTSRAIHLRFWTP